MNDQAWTETTLGALIDVEHGWPFQSLLFSEELSGRPIVVAVGNFRYSGGFRFDSTTVKEYRGDYPREFELSAGDILLVMTCQTPGGEILGIPARVPNDGRIYLHNQRLGKVVLQRPDLADIDFLYFLFLSREFNDELVASSTGTKIVHTAPSRIEAFRFSLPPLGTQRAIAALLRAIDEKISSNEDSARSLGTLATMLFSSWFVDFDPVTAKRASERPFGVPAHAIDLFPSHFEESAIGPIPQGWRVLPLDSVADFRNGLALQRYPPRDADVLPVIKIAELRARSNAGADLCSGVPPEYVIDDGDVIFSWSGSLMVDVWCGGEGALNQHLFKVTSRKVPNWFYLGWLNEHLPEFQAIAADKATTMGHIRRFHLTDAKVLVPPEPLMKAMTSVQQPLLDQIIHNRLEARTLAELRDTLLPPLLSGELTIKSAEKTVGAAL